MLVRDRMTAGVLTVTPATSFDRALRLMRERQVRRFPVVDRQDRLIGIVSEKDLLNAAPSPATTLDRFEIHDLLDRLKVAEVMTRGVIVVPPELPIEEAARIMADNKIGGLPVVDADQRLAGIITETDLFRTMTELLGARRKGLRITFSIQEHHGALAELTSEIARQGGNIQALGIFEGDDQTHPVIMIKLTITDQDRLIATLRGKHATILDVRTI